MPKATGVYDGLNLWQLVDACDANEVTTTGEEDRLELIALLEGN